MKKLIFLITILGFTSFARAQTTNSPASKNSPHSSANKKSKKIKASKKGTVMAETLNNRKIYKSKRTGQRATPTGQEATGTNGSHANNPKNAARKEE